MDGWYLVVQTARDYSATSLLGPMSTPSQDTNSELVNALYHFWAPLNKASLDYPPAVRHIVSPSIEVCLEKKTTSKRARDLVADPFFGAG
jgi:hypothetical protein